MFKHGDIVTHVVSGRRMMVIIPPVKGVTWPPVECRYYNPTNGLYEHNYFCEEELYPAEIE